MYYNPIKFHSIKNLFFLKIFLAVILTLLLSAFILKSYRKVNNYYDTLSVYESVPLYENSETLPKLPKLLPIKESMQGYKVGASKEDVIKYYRENLVDYGFHVISSYENEITAVKDNIRISIRFDNTPDGAVTYYYVKAAKGNEL